MSNQPTRGWKNEDRFWYYTDKRTPDECWEWQGTIITTPSSGYGTLSITGTNNRELAHRFSYRLHKGEIPDGLCVCHTCDNRLCVNPNHLWLGTKADNAHDRDRKGHQISGFTINPHRPRRKYSEEVISYIKSFVPGKHGDLSKLSKETGVSKSYISALQRGDTNGRPA